MPEKTPKYLAMRATRKGPDLQSFPVISPLNTKKRQYSHVMDVKNHGENLASTIVKLCSLNITIRLKRRDFRVKAIDPLTGITFNMRPKTLI
jgi:hypothetical protein